MRTDHHAYQRATRVAGVGFLIQLGVGLVMLVFGLVGGTEVPQDTTFLFGSLYILLGLLAWLGLIVVFNQQKLERLEALEEDELALSRSGGTEGGGRAESVFATHDDEIRVAARRLRLMHKWLMPILSLVIAAGLGLLAWLMLRKLGEIAAGEAVFHRTEHRGWGVAVCLAFSAMSFIVSRFVAGMAKQPAWQNLRGGAAYMVGNALVTLAIAVGIGFRFFKNEDVIRGIAYAIPIFMLVLAAEIILNFVLNLYRPRVPGETPRPAFDSKILSLFSAPDSLVRSINEAVNYQFGFDITSSWGYQLLLRSFAWLLALFALAMMVLNMLVIVEPNQQAVKLRRGALVDDRVFESGMLWKLPWPFETVEVHDVTTLRELPLTARAVANTEVLLWTDDLGRKFDRPLEPFVVGSSRLRPAEYEDTGLASASEDADAAEAGELAQSVSLVDAEIRLLYRIRADDDGLLDYLHFASDDVSRRSGSTRRQETLASIALREVTQALSRLSIDEILAVRRASLPDALRARVQAAFDANHAGVDVVSVDLPLLQPAGDAAPGFEELSMSHEARQQFVAAAEQKVVAGLAQLVGDASLAEGILAEIDVWERLSDEHGPDAEATIAQRVLVEQLVTAGGGQAAQVIALAERDRWVRLMGARSEASRLRGQILAYHAAPRLYRERETMIVYRNKLPSLFKYVLGIDPSRVDFDVDLTELNPMFSIGDAFEEESGSAPMNKPIAVAVGLLVLLLLLLFSSTFTVKFDEVAIKATFGETDEQSVITDPGLHFRLPVFIDKVTKLDTRLQVVESPMSEITTSDGLQIVVRAFLLWRVDTNRPTGPLDFFKSYMSIDGAAQELRGQFRTVYTGALSQYDFEDLIGETSQLTEAEGEIKSALTATLVTEGIDPVAVGISRIMLPPKTSSAVLSRMQATRNILAEGERNAGTAEAERIRSEGNSWADKIRAFANQRAEEIRAVGEREAARYLEQMGEDEDLAIFLVWLDTLERVLDRNTTVILPTDFAPLHLLNPKSVEMRGGIPQPSGSGALRAKEPATEADTVVEGGS